MKQDTGKTVFIDRDGVINHDSPDYIKSADEFDFISGSPEAFRLLSENGFNAIIITNQSVIGRGLVSLEGLELVFEKMRKGIEMAGGRILDIFFCPHVPEDNCCCRKPEPGLFLNAKEKYAVDMASAYMIGDNSKDMIAAKKAGVGTVVLVRTGSGEKTLKKISEGTGQPDFVAENLLEAVKTIISKNTGNS